MTLNWPLVYPKRPFIDTNRIFCTLLFTEVVFTKYLYLDFFERQGWIELCRNFSINLIREQERLVNVLYGRPLLFGPMPGAHDPWVMGRPRWLTTIFFRLQSILKPTTMNWDFFKSNIYHIVKWYECKIEGICPCCPCNMMNMLDMPSTFSTCFCPVSRTDKHGRKQIILEYILQWGPLRVPHDRWIKTKFKFFQIFSRFRLIFKISEVFHSSTFNCSQMFN